MPATSKLDPALLDLVKALAQMAVAQEATETEEARPQLAQLRAAFRLDDDPLNWKRKVEGLMKAFYKHVPHWGDIRLKDRVRLLVLAVGELGQTAPYKRLALRAGELALAEAASTARNRTAARRPRR